MFGKKICQWCVQHEAAQRGELPDDAPQPVMAAPWVRRGESSVSLTQVILGANVMVFIAMVIASHDPSSFLNPMQEFAFPVSVRFGANYGLYTLSGQWWRLLTYMFLHGSVLHIAFNMWCLWELGQLCESLYGRWTFAGIYLITGIAGGVGSLAWNPGVWSVGASGAIFGLAGALIASFYLGEFSLPKMAIQATLKSLVFFVGFNVLFGSMFPGIDNACHAGGLLSGLILGAVIARLAPGHDALRRAGVVALVALMVVTAALGVQRWRGGAIRAGLAFASISADDPNQSIAKLQAIVKQQPSLTAAHFALAQAYFDREQYPQAEGEFKKGLELQPQNAAARFALGITLLNERRSDEAKAAFTQMLAQDANNGDAHYGLGLVLADGEKYQTAIDEFKAAANSGAPISGLYYEMGRAYAELKQYDDAIAAYVREKEKDGDQPDVEFALAQAYQAKGMTQQAQDARNKAAQLRGQGRN